MVQASSSSRILPYRSFLFRVVVGSFLCGAGMETFMIYGRIGSETFYDTAKRKEIERRPERRRKNEEYREQLLHALEEQRGDSSSSSGVVLKDNNKS